MELLYKQNEREIVANAKIKYDLVAPKNLTIEISPEKSKISNLDNILDSSITNNSIYTYGALEENLFKLDGNIHLAKNPDTFQLIDFTKIRDYSTTHSFVDDKLTVTAKTGIYNQVQYNVTDLIKNNRGKILWFSCEDIDLSEYKTTNNIMVDFRIVNDGTTTYPPLMRKDLSQISYTVPSDTSKITNAMLRILPNNVNVENVGSKLVLTKPILSFSKQSIYAPYGEYETGLLNAGYTSANAMSSSDFSFSFKIYNSTPIEEEISGLTIYFDEVAPTKMSLKYTYSSSSGDKTITINQENKNEDDRVYFDFGEKIKSIKSIELSVTEWNTKKRRLRIKKVDFGYSEVIEAKDIISMDIDETSRRICTEVPINECNLQINDLNNRFDIINPENISKKINKFTEIEPYLGIKDKNGNIEYTYMGLYYLDTYSHNEDNTAALNFKSILNLLNNNRFSMMVASITGYEIKGYANTDITPYRTYLREEDGSKYMNINMKYIIGSKYPAHEQKDYIKFERYSGVEKFFSPLSLYNITDKDDIITFFQNLSIANFGNVLNGVNVDDYDNSRPYIVEPIKLLQINTENIKNINKINEEYTINLNELTNFPKIEKINKINTIDLKYHEFNGIAYDPNNYDSSITLTPEQGKLSLLEFDDSINWEPNIEQQAMEKGLCFANNSFQNKVIYYTLSPTATQTSFTLKYATSSNGFDNEISLICTNKKDDEDEVKLEINTRYMINKNVSKNLANKYLEIMNNYDVSFEFAGDPHYVCGDQIKLETKYGPMAVYIERLHFKYDGGLSCEVEGIA